MSGTFVTIGVPEEPVYIPAEEGVTKIGGIPKWLCGEPENFKELKCKKCKCQLAHILSCDCPIDDVYDRVLYLFICPKCGQEARVFRQKKLAVAPKDNVDNEFMDENSKPKEPENNGNLFGQNDFIKKETTPDDLFAAFNSFSNNLNNKQQNKKKGGNNNNNQPKKGKKSNRPQKEIGRFPAYYIETFEEPEATLAKGMNVTISGSNDSTASMLGEEDLPDYGITPELVEFNERMSRCPDQVLRYARFDEPLTPEKLEINVPPCPRCGEKRVFEVELMPTIIYTLEPDSSMDFGPILVYTCSKDCNEGSCEEFCHITPPI